MKAASIAEIKKELKERPAAELVELCLQLTRFKKDNKELLTYILFESHDWPAYVQNIKEEMDEGFEGLNSGSLFWIKKGLRKILRITNKHIRYMGQKEGEVRTAALLYPKDKRS